MTSLGAWGPFIIPLLAVHVPLLLRVTDSSAVDNAEAVSKTNVSNNSVAIFLHYFNNDVLICSFS